MMQSPTKEPGKYMMQSPTKEPGKQMMQSPTKEPGKYMMQSPIKEPGKYMMQSSTKEPGKYTLSDIIITDITCTLEASAWIIMSVKITSVKIMSVNNKVRNNIGPFQYGLSGIRHHRLVDNCRKMTVYMWRNSWYWISISRHLNWWIMNPSLYVFRNNFLKRKLVFTVRKIQNFPDSVERE